MNSGIASTSVLCMVCRVLSSVLFSLGPPTSSLLGDKRSKDTAKQSSLKCSSYPTASDYPTKYQVFNLERNPIPSPAHLSAMKTEADRTRV